MNTLARCHGRTRLKILLWRRRGQSWYWRLARYRSARSIALGRGHYSRHTLLQPGWIWHYRTALDRRRNRGIWWRWHPTMVWRGHDSRHIFAHFWGTWHYCTALDGRRNRRIWQRWHPTMVWHTPDTTANGELTITAFTLTNAGCRGGCVFWFFTGRCRIIALLLHDVNE
jgi:hypothetical protein